jgi:Zn2+/Cd2+-exporting ATPase
MGGLSTHTEAKASAGTAYDRPGSACCVTSAPVRPSTRPTGHRMPPWLSQTPVILTAVTFVAMITGLLVDWQTEATVVAWSFYGAAYVSGGIIGVRSSIASLRQGFIDIDLLMILAALGALVIGAPFEGAMLLFLFSLSNVLQGFAMGRTRRAIEALMELRPDAATVVRADDEVTVPLDAIEAGDIVRVRPGERLPLDGIVVHGESMIDQSSITGESIAVMRGIGDDVFAGTFNEEGSLDIRVTAPASASTLVRLIELVENAQKEKATTQRVIERAEQTYATAVLVLTGVAIAVPWAFMAEAFDATFYRAMTLMVAASPCALVISTPATILSAIGNGARRGILFKGGAHVEQAAGIRVVAFDKTGTLTEGKPRLTDIRLLDGIASEDDILSIAAAIQHRSEHHLAAAIRTAADERDLTIPAVEGFRAEPGRGVEGTVGGRVYRIGNARFFGRNGMAEATAPLVAPLEREGKTTVLMTESDGPREFPIALLAFKDVLRPGVREMLDEVRSAGIDRIVMLTGDNEDVAAVIAEEAGIDEYHAALLPAEKVARVRALEARYGGIAMVGDGVNDAPALATASLGIAMGAAGTDVALETADIVLMADDIGKLPYLIALSRATRRTLITNLSFAIGIIGVMIAMILTVGLPLPLAVLGHEGSTVLVSLNGIRLLAFKFRPDRTPRHRLAPGASAIRV